jgi:ring-1,2-phenylacetyl-CoA epoxidase subunit PaaD
VSQLALHEATVRSALADVPDPEIPVVSVVDLGMVDQVEVGSDGIRVTLLPTFVGCPALDVIRERVERRLRAFDRPVDVRFDYRVPWTSDRITPQGHDKLRASGFAPPTQGRPDQPVLVQLRMPVACPSCGSRRTVLENAFGPTRCRAIHHCTDCRQPFESFKPV